MRCCWTCRSSPRTSRRIGLTDAGRAYVAASKRILEQVEEAERTASGEYREPRGELNVTAPIVFGRRHLLPIALEFLAAHAEIDLRLLLIDRSVTLHEEHIDLALRIGVLGDSSLIGRRIGGTESWVVGSPAYLDRHGRPAHPDALRDHQMIRDSNAASAHRATFVIDSRITAMRLLLSIWTPLLFLIDRLVTKRVVRL